MFFPLASNRRTTSQKRHTFAAYQMRDDDKVDTASSAEAVSTPHETVYEMALHPAFDASFFESPDDIALNQLPIYDVDDTMVRPWNVHRVLVEGALVLSRVQQPDIMPTPDKLCQGQIQAQLCSTIIRGGYKRGPSDSRPQKARKAIEHARTGTKNTDND
ncbi:hypothetical protein FS842_008562 [Serendipita sp. 407]|nr:hypothetical protein FS842_008562 [Serendipita sp. 407]